MNSMPYMSEVLGYETSSKASNKDLRLLHTSQGALTHHVRVGFTNSYLQQSYGSLMQGL